jgi:hypothetical protein
VPLDKAVLVGPWQKRLLPTAQKKLPPTKKKPPFLKEEAVAYDHRIARSPTADKK